MAGMALFRTDSLVLCYSDVQVAKQWWIAVFDCKQARIPSDWDDQLPSDMALKLPGSSQPTILLSSKSEVQSAGFVRSNEHPIIFSDKLKIAYQHLLARGAVATPIQEVGGTEYFEVQDSEGNRIEVCRGA